ncbi:DUF4116 domain-containing protein [Escherichia marmotae]|uniref:DUF4116 domain-containing protein n=1 Tax=Escherichia marmotae TaxID=1499973 RepID=UPI00069372C7|nr:DUF4116 domain-containing protein [Escherichia marmotae]AUT30031.1 DUF4116 domain-containing protein [Escherichia marmotae]
MPIENTQNNVMSVYSKNITENKSKAKIQKKIQKKIQSVANDMIQPVINEKSLLEKQNLASNIITKTIRNSVADKAYSHMFSTGKAWKEMEMSSTGIKIMRQLSTDNIRKLYRDLTPLNEKETIFFDRMLKMKFTATHASNAIITNENNTMELFSRKKLEQRAIDFEKNHTEPDDINEIGNDDFVFFSLEPGEGGKKNRSRFGKYIYTVDFDNPVFTQIAWGSLQDQILNQTGNVRTHIKGLSEEAYNYLSERNIENKETMFIGKDIKTGLVMSLIKLFRNIPDDDKEKLLSINTVDGMNKLINGIFRPEIKVPRHFFSKDVGVYFTDVKGLKLTSSDFDNKHQMLSAIKECADAFFFASSRLKEDEELIIEAMPDNLKILGHVPEKVKNERALALKLVSTNGLALSYLPDNFKDDLEIVQQAVKNNSDALQFSSTRLKNDRSVVLLAMQHDEQSLKYASEQYRDDETLVFPLIRKDGLFLQYVSDRLKNDKSLVCSAINNNIYAIKYASEELRNSDIMRNAIKNDSALLEFASKRLRDEESLIQEAIQKDSDALMYASDRIKNNEEIVLQAIQKKGQALEYASDSLRNNMRIVSTAVIQNGLALKFASTELRDNEDIVMLAIKNDDRALRYASDRIKTKIMSMKAHLD